LFLEGNTASHKAGINHQKLQIFILEFMKDPACSPDLAPSEYYLFHNLKKHINGRNFSSIDEDMTAADG
jgi:hypothetical protein